MNALIHIVEDDAAIRESLKLLLETRGFEVAAYRSGEELMDSADNGRCACLILDVNLPGADGFDVLAQLRSRGLETPAIFMSGLANARMRARARTAQAALFAKPVVPADLLGEITRATART